MNLQQELQKIHDDKGELTPALVVDRARDESHPLHSRFEWDDTVAGEAYRREQAHRLIRSVTITYAHDEHGPRQVRAFVAVSRGGVRPTYEPVATVVADDILRQRALNELREQIARLQRRYGHLEEFAALMREAAS
jgi:hypothetical protein